MDMFDVIVGEASSVIVPLKMDTIKLMQIFCVAQKAKVSPNDYVLSLINESLGKHKFSIDEREDSFFEIKLKAE